MMRAQESTATLINRYPNIFGFLRTVMATRHGPDLGGETIRILSFGCSTGAEVLSVRAYFPDAEILGCDINTAALSASVNALDADSRLNQFERSMLSTWLPLNSSTSSRSW